MENSKRDSEEGKPIEMVFAYKTGTFDGPLPESKYEPISVERFLILKGLVNFFSFGLIYRDFYRTED